MTEECELPRVCPGVNVGHHDLRTDTAKTDSVSCSTYNSTKQSVLF